ncbi:MAG: carboxymuconolactone decarboxylase family protein [Acidobacteriota bacterium]|nr:carboxymuconolactone decarboxylase family protein [Acidobacteriota bacterium]
MNGNSSNHRRGAQEDLADPADLSTPNQRKASYSMIEPRMKRIYFEFYRETYSSQCSCLDRKTQELIAIAASLTAKCQGCLEGHIKKALKEGATKEEIAEAIAIAMGVNAAAVVDLTDAAAAHLNLEFFK